MKKAGFFYLAILALFVLHNDFWLWNNDRLVAGLPAGLLYHVIYCVAVSSLFLLLVRFAWPSTLDCNPPDLEKS